MDWHRLFGLVLTDFFTDSPFVVELEKDLSAKKQLLDVLIVRKRPGTFRLRLPDGFEDLAEYNLITFKSHHEALTDWVLKELTGHYVNLRKHCSLKGKPLLPETAFRLYAVCSRHPHNLATEVPLEPVAAGVYDCRRGTDVIRVIVAGEVPRQEQNALLHLFSAQAARVDYGARHYQQHSSDTSTLLERLRVQYRGEGIAMAYTMADFRRDFAQEFWKSMTPEERRMSLRQLAPEELGEALRALPPEELGEALRALSADKLLEALSPEEIEQALKKRHAQRSPRPKKPRRRD